MQIVGLTFNQVHVPGAGYFRIHLSLDGRQIHMEKCTSPAGQVPAEITLEEAALMLGRLVQKDPADILGGTKTAPAPSSVPPPAPLAPVTRETPGKVNLKDPEANKFYEEICSVEEEFKKITDDEWGKLMGNLGHLVQRGYITKEHGDYLASTLDAARGKTSLRDMSIGATLTEEGEEDIDDSLGANPEPPVETPKIRPAKPADPQPELFNAPPKAKTAPPSAPKTSTQEEVRKTEMEGFMIPESCLIKGASLKDIVKALYVEGGFRTLDSMQKVIKAVKPKIHGLAIAQNVDERVAGIFAKVVKE